MGLTEVRSVSFVLRCLEGESRECFRTEERAQKASRMDPKVQEGHKCPKDTSVQLR